MTIINGNDIRDAAEIIRRGKLVAMPTETVYGLAADATNDKAVARIFEAKGRPQFNPLIVHVADAAMAQHFVEWPPLADRLSKKFWPGPLTLVLKRRADCEVSLLASAGLETLGVRAPKHGIAQALIKAAHRPLAAPSANRSGEISPTQADHARKSLGGRVDRILDGGPCLVGVESTIVRIDGETVYLLRPGGVSRDELQYFLEASVLDAPYTMQMTAPGMLASHYAPRAPLRLNASRQRDGEAFLGFGVVAGAGPYSLNLSACGDLAEAAANLFRHLHALDRISAAYGLKAIAAAPVPMQGVGEAINDRLKRAAAPRR